MKVGDIVENFILNDQWNNEYELYKNLETDLLLVFYPKDNTLVCTKQLQNYSLNRTKLEELGIKIVGININSTNSHNSFCTDNAIELPILSDIEGKISKYFDAVNFLGLNKRKIVLIGRDKKVKFIKSTMATFYLDIDKIIAQLKHN